MILIADSGSTKCDWALVDGETVEEFSTTGFNPMFHSSIHIQNEIRNNKSLMSKAGEVSELYYYGAGCQNESMNDIVREGLHPIFTNAKIIVDHDLTGAVYAGCGNEAGIACILGTGSNSVYFDGKKIHEDFPGLGYILGDEGSGAYFGKQLLANFLYKKLPANLMELLREEHNLSKEVIFRNVYMRPNANVYLASFMRTIKVVKDDPWVKSFLYKGLSTFIDLHVWKYPDYKDVPTHFIGSIAFFYQDLLKKACESHRINIGKIIKKPIDSLVEFHLSGEYQKASH